MRWCAAGVAAIGKGIVMLPDTAHKLGILAELARMYVRARIYNKHIGEKWRRTQCVIFIASTLILGFHWEIAEGNMDVGECLQKGSCSDSMMMREKGAGSGTRTRGAAHVRPAGMKKATY